MTDPAHEDAIEGLGEYLGKDIIRTSVKITKAGDGLSKSVGIAPQLFAQGDELMVLLKVKVGQHIHKPIPETECLELVQEFEAITATIVDDKTSARRIAQQENELAKAAEKAKGTQRLPGTENAIDGKKDGDGDEDEDPGNVTAIDAKSAAAGERPDQWEDPARPGAEESE